MADAEWLKTLKADDRVVACKFDGRVQDFCLLTVTKITSQFITAMDETGGEMKFRRKDRWQVGYKENYAYTFWRLHATEAAHLEEQERHSLSEQLHDFRHGFRSLDVFTTDQLRRIVAILNEGTTP